MNGLFWAGVGLCVGAASLFAYQRRLLTRHNLPEPVLIQCGKCWETYVCTDESNVRAAMMLHADYKCSLSGYDAWRDVA